MKNVGLVVLLLPIYASFFGLIVGWPILYFRSGFSGVKSAQGIDWREFLVPCAGWFISRWLFGWVVLIRWIQAGRPPPLQAVVSIDGQPCRRMLSPSQFRIHKGVATSH